MVVVSCVNLIDVVLIVPFNFSHYINLILITSIKNWAKINFKWEPLNATQIIVPHLKTLTLLLNSPSLTLQPLLLTWSQQNPLHCHHLTSTTHGHHHQS